MDFRVIEADLDWQNATRLIGDVGSSDDATSLFARFNRKENICAASQTSSIEVNTRDGRLRLLRFINAATDKTRGSRLSRSTGTTLKDHRSLRTGEAPLYRPDRSRGAVVLPRRRVTRRGMVRQYGFWPRGLPGLSPCCRCAAARPRPLLRGHSRLYGADGLSRRGRLIVGGAPGRPADGPTKHAPRDARQCVEPTGSNVERVDGGMRRKGDGGVPNAGIGAARHPPGPIEAHRIVSAWADR